MIVRGLLATLLLGGVMILVNSAPVSALGLKIAPLEYKTTLKKSESKKGFIDVSNPSGQTINVRTSVQAFRQIDNNGGLEFFDDKEIKLGIQTDLELFELGPHEAVRMYFLVDGQKLPEGDIFAAIFFTTEPKQPRNGVGQLVRVGTILSIVNNTPGKRDAEITKLDLPWFQLNDDIKGSYSIRNTAKIGERSGFFPEVSTDIVPGGKRQVSQSSLVMAGRTRTNDFTYSAAGIGIHKVTVSYKESQRSRWVVTATPIALIFVVIVLSLIIIEALLWHRRKR